MLFLMKAVAWAQAWARLGLGLGFLGLGAWAQDLASLSPQKPSPALGFQAELGPHITNDDEW